MWPLILLILGFLIFVLSKIGDAAIKYLDFLTDESNKL
jgi:hypothetical protein